MNETDSQNTQGGGQGREKKLEEKGSEALQSSPNSQLLTPNSSAELRSADPFFSGRKHYPALDGLRGLAILMVIFCHYRNQFPDFGRLSGIIRHAFGWGWIGVDLFFVLSGFLITGILYDSKGQKHYFKNFYARRFLRIFPLYYSFLAILLLGLAAFQFLRPAAYGDSQAAHNLWSSQIWLWTYTFNIRSALEKNTVIQAVSHLWSLSVEEQFYMVWPLIVFLVPSRKLIQVCLGIIIASPLIRLIATGMGVSGWAIYTLTPFRLDGFAAGAFLAIYLKTHGNPAANLAKALRMSGILGFILMALTFLLRHRWPWITDLRYSALAFLFTWLLFLAITPGRTPIGKLTLAAPLRWLGKYSYGIYVFHLPILEGNKAAFNEIGWLGAIYSNKALCILFAAFNVAVALTAAYISYNLYEKHFLKLKKYFPERTAAGVPQRAKDDITQAGS